MLLFWKGFNGEGRVALTRDALRSFENFERVDAYKFSCHPIQLLRENHEILGIAKETGEPCKTHEAKLFETMTEQVKEHPLCLFNECVAPDCALNRLKFPQNRWLFEHMLVKHIRKKYGNRAGTQRALTYCMFEPGMLFSDLCIFEDLIVNGKFRRFNIHIVKSDFAEILPHCKDNEPLEWEDGSVEPVEKLRWMRLWVIRLAQFLKFFEAHNCKVSLMIWGDIRHYLQADRESDVFCAMDYFDQFPKHVYTVPFYSVVATKPDGIIALARTDGLGLDAKLNVHIDIRACDKRTTNTQCLASFDQLEKDIQECNAALEACSDEYKGVEPEFKWVERKVEDGKLQVGYESDPDDPNTRHPEWQEHKTKIEELRDAQRRAEEAWMAYCLKRLEASRVLFQVAGMNKCTVQFMYRVFFPLSCTFACEFVLQAIKSMWKGVRDFVCKWFSYL